MDTDPGPAPAAGEPPSAPPAGLVGRLRAAGCVFAEDEAGELVAAAADADDLERLVLRRVAGEPLEHVVGRVRWAGLDLAVSPGVFVPRRRTALLARAAARAAAGVAAGAAAGGPAGRAPVVVDLCCGVGAVAALVLRRVPGARVHAGDLDPAAVACARANLAGTSARVAVGDLYDALPRALRGRVDVLCVNAPYVPTGEVRLLPREAREHEPLLALDGGPDGLDVHRRVLAGAREWLAPGGTLLAEVGEPQLATYLALAAEVAMVGEPVRGPEDPDGSADLVVRATPSPGLGSISQEV